MHAVQSVIETGGDVCWGLNTADPGDDDSFRKIRGISVKLEAENPRSSSLRAQRCGNY